MDILRQMPTTLNMYIFTGGADINTRKETYLLSRETVYVEKIENGFGYIEYTNEKGQTSKGWLKMEDLQSCADCGKSREASSGGYELLEDHECEIKDAKLTLYNTSNRNFNFSLIANGSEQDGMTMSGSLNGQATFISDSVAIFKDQNCKSLTFTFYELNIIKVEELECNYYHGAGICFSASFIKPAK